MENGISLSTSEYDHIFILCLSVVLLHAKKSVGERSATYFIDGGLMRNTGGL